MSSSTPSSTPSPELSGSRKSGLDWGLIASAGITILVVFWFYAFETRFGYRNSFSALGWLYGNWQSGSEIEHGKFVPFITLGLIAYRFKEIRQSIDRGSWVGVAAVAFGCLCYFAAYRTIQPRIAIFGLPFILCGLVYGLYGWKTTKFVAFPIFLILGVIPLPSFQQATTSLQLLATQIAHYGSALFGVETYTQGTTILPIKGDWKPLSIAHGCSGIRSLMALFMITVIWAYIAKISLWKKALLFLSAIPLAIVGNSLRIVSIFVIAEYGDAKWASTTWHDWSGLLLFYPFSIFLLMVFHSLLAGELPWRKNKKRTVRKTVHRKENQTTESA